MRRLFLALLAACAAAPAAAADGPIKVVTSFTVIADMVRNVAGEHAQVVSVTRPGAEVHGYQPTPRDLVAAQDADLVLWNGMGLESWFAQFLDNLGDVPSAVLSDGVAPIPVAGANDPVPNPHAWMSPTSAGIYVDNIARALGAVDPANAADYARNAAAYRGRIDAALAPLQARLAAVQPDKRWLVTCEGAFSYLARDFALREVSLWPINTDSTGTPQQIRRVIDTVRDHRIPVVFCESTVNADPARRIARETGAAYGGALYVDSLSGPDGPVPTYLDLLRVTAATIADGLTREPG